MLKLTRRLFSFRPDAFYADFHERALFNHALASFDPDDVRTSYMVPVGRAEQQEYQDMLRASPAAWAPGWRTTRCTATASTTSRRIRCG